MFIHVWGAILNQTKVISQTFQCAVSHKARVISAENRAKNTKYKLKNFCKLFKIMYLITEPERNDKRTLRIQPCAMFSPYSFQN